MKENVVQELQQMQPNEQTKQKMLDILKRFHSEEEMDSTDEDSFEDSALSEETMEKIMSGMFLLNTYPLLRVSSNCSTPAPPVKQIFIHGWVRLILFSFHYRTRNQFR